MKVHVKHSLKTDVAAAFKLCTEQKSQEQVYAKLGGSDLKIKREGRAPNVQLRISRKMPANPPAAIRRIVPSTNEVSHVEKWAADGDGHAADIVVEIKGVPRAGYAVKLVHHEGVRQHNLLKLRDELRYRGLAARDAVSALTNLGYAHGQAAAAISAAIGRAGREARAEELIRLGLKELAQ